MWCIGSEFSFFSSFTTNLASVLHSCTCIYMYMNSSTSAISDGSKGMGCTLTRDRRHQRPPPLHDSEEPSSSWT